MTPAARLSAAIGCLDQILAGVGAEVALTNWGRASRYAGSGDRHAVRDLVFDALRCKRSYAALGGGNTGRGLILGGLRHAGQSFCRSTRRIFRGQSRANFRLGELYPDPGRSRSCLQQRRTLSRRYHAEPRKSGTDW